LVAQAESLAALGETPRAFALASQATSQDDRNARAWLARGLTAAAQRPFPLARFGLPSTAFNEWQREAVESLTRATRLAPDSGRYWLELGTVQTLSTEAAARQTALTALQKGRDLALAAREGAIVSRANEAIGWWHWRQFERHVAMLQSSPEAHNELRSATLGDSARRDSLNNFLEWGHGWQSDYLDATEHFERAVFADSANARARYDVLRALVTFERWHELLEVAQQQVRDISWDAWSWLALGLARQRLGERTAAAAAFDSAMTHLTARERDYLLDVSRILEPSAVAAYRQHVPAIRESVNRFYWLHSDPLWLEPGNQRWMEFLSRLTFAELRWGVPELGVRGLETDFGKVYMRFGAPSRITGADTNRVGDPHVTWSFNAGVRFRFVTQPLLGAAQLDPESEQKLGEIAATTPVSWPAAVDDGYAVRDVAIQSAVFFPRSTGDAGSDSLSAVVLLPTGGGALPNAESAIYLADRAGRAERMPTIAAGTLLSDTTWTAFEARAPGVSAYLRLETRDSTARHATRAAAELAPIAEALPHVSDIMIARCLTNRAQRPNRWFDARISFTSGTDCPADRLLLFWEEGTTDDGIDGGTARITITSGVDDDLESLLRNAADPRAPAIEVRALGTGEVNAPLQGLAQRGNREVTISLPLNPVSGRAQLRWVELSLRAVKRGSFVVTLTRSIPAGRAVTRERRVPWN
jgi:GWxTD domain-containing protein